MPKRMPRVNELIQRTLAEIFSKQLDIPLEFFITIVRTNCAPDLKTAKICLSIFPYLNAEAGLRYIVRRRREIQKLFGQKIKLQFTPKLTFELDSSEEAADNIYSLMEQL